jgi:hypothetical protein
MPRPAAGARRATGASPGTGGDEALADRQDKRTATNYGIAKPGGKRDKC